MEEKFLFVVTDTDSLEILKKNQVLCALSADLKDPEVAKSHKLVLLYQQDEYSKEEKCRPGYKKALAVANYFYNKGTNKVYILKLPKADDYEGSYTFADWYSSYKGPNLEESLKKLLARRSCPYFPGWEYMSHFERMQRHYLNKIETSEQVYDLNRAKQTLLANIDCLFEKAPILELYNKSAECCAAIEYFIEGLYNSEKKCLDPMERPK